MSAGVVREEKDPQRPCSQQQGRVMQRSSPDAGGVFNAKVPHIYCLGRPRWESSPDHVPSPGATPATPTSALFSLSEELVPFPQLTRVLQDAVTAWTSGISGGRK